MANGILRGNDGVIVELHCHVKIGRIVSKVAQVVPVLHQIGVKQRRVMTEGLNGERSQ